MRLGAFALALALALAVGTWQLCQNAAVVVQILVATRTLGLSAQAVGMCYVVMGLGTVLASVVGHRVSARIGLGPCLVLGFGISSLDDLIRPIEN